MEATEEEVIIANLQEDGSGKLYEDPSFPPDLSSLYRSQYSVALYDNDIIDQVIWHRPCDFSSDPEYFKDVNQIGDLVESRGLDDAWFLGALAMVASHPDALLENVFAPTSADAFLHYGVFTARFYKNGEWKEVVTDTRLPCAPPTATSVGHHGPKNFNPIPLYGRCRDIGEQWMALLEKAYAKLHGSYEAALHTGSVAEALVDLTGGAVDKIFLTEPHHREAAESGALWEKLKKWKANGCLLGTVHTNPGITKVEETTHGLLKNRPYAIIDLREVHGVRLVRLRNPYEKGGWKGDWSNNSEIWADDPDVLAAIRTDPTIHWIRSVQGDGTTWMAYEDLATDFNKLYVVHIFHNEKYKQYCAKGEWVGKHAGGTFRTKEAASKDDVSSSRGGGGDVSTTTNAAAASSASIHSFLKGFSSNTILPDGDSYWFNNPQYRLTTTKKIEVFVSLMQQDRRGPIALRDNHPVAVEVIRRRKDPTHFRVWDHHTEEVVGRSVEAKFAQREVVLPSLEIEPGYSYNIVPHSQRNGREGKFILRIFSREVIVMEKVPETFTTYLSGAWERSSERESTGGPLQVAESNHVKENTKWCQNPQYWVQIPQQPNLAHTNVSQQQTVDLKIVLKRLNDKHHRDSNGKNAPKFSKDPSEKEPEQFLGLVVCRVPDESASAAAGNGKKAGGQQGGADDGLSKSSIKKESTLKRRRPIVKKADKDGDMSQMIQRKLFIKRDEWVRISDYSSTEGATMTILRIDPSWIPRGLLIVPTLSERNARGAFNLEIHSDMPGIVAQELLESKSKTLTAVWDSETGCGSHLHPDWRKNPKFSLRLHGTEEVEVKITLSRSEKEWKSQVAKDSLGSMIGFYIYTGSKANRESEAIMYNGQSWTESAFVPMHEVSTPVNFTLKPLFDDESYVIMPTTFEPGKKGGFFLSVVTDAEFSFKKDQPALITTQRGHR